MILYIIKLDKQKKVAFATKIEGIPQRKIKNENEKS